MGYMVPYTLFSSLFVDCRDAMNRVPLVNLCESTREGGRDESRPYRNVVHFPHMHDSVPYICSRISTKCPAIAAAAAIAGLTRCVRPPRPWRPSKLRLLVEAQRSPGCRMSGFIPRHMEQPGSRHSKPASRNTL